MIMAPILAQFSCSILVTILIKDVRKKVSIVLSTIAFFYIFYKEPKYQEGELQCKSYHND